MEIKKIDLSASAISEKTREIDSKLLTVSGEQVRSKLTDIGLFILVLITAVISYGDVNITTESTVNITLMTVLIYIATTVVHQNKYDGGLLKGKQTIEYKTARIAYENCVDKVYDLEMATELPDLCLRYVKTELENYRRNILAETFITYEEYLDKYSTLGKKQIEKCEELSPEVKKLINTANRAKPINLTARQLLNPEGSARRKINVLGTSGTEARSIDFKVNMGRRIITTLLAGTMVVSFASDPSWEALAQWAARMFPIITGYVLGYNKGFITGSVTSVIFLENQTEKLRTMIEWHEKEI